MDKNQAFLNHSKLVDHDYFSLPINEFEITTTIPTTLPVTSQGIDKSQRNKEIKDKNNKFIDELFDVTTSGINKMFTNQKHLVTNVAFDSIDDDKFKNQSHSFKRVKELERILSKTMFQLNSVQAELKDEKLKSKQINNKRDVSIEDQQRWPKRTRLLPELKDGFITKDLYGKDVVNKSVSIRIEDNLISFDSGKSFLYRISPTVQPTRFKKLRTVKNFLNS